MNQKFSFALITSAFFFVQTAILHAAPPGQRPLLQGQPGERGFIKIFNGTDLSGWEGNPKLWSVQDGAITGQTTADNPAKGNTFLIWTNGSVGDFELRCSFKIVANNDQGFANSGIQYRSKVLDANNWVVGGYQADMEAGLTYTGILYEERLGRGIMAARGEKVVWNKDCKKEVVGSLGDSKELQAAIKAGDWNDYVVIAKGSHLQHFINGQQTVDLADECEEKRAMTGVLALQLHAGPPMTVQFRNLRLKTLSTEGVAAGDDMNNLQGAWQVAKIEAEGEAVPSEDVKNMAVTIKDHSYKLMNSDGEQSGRFTINPSATPRQIDIHVESGPNEGQDLKGIYEVGADSLRVCHGKEGSKRPESFSSTADSGCTLITLKRKP